MTNAIETVNTWSQSWLDFMLYRVVDSTIVFLLIGALWLLVRHRASARFGYFLFVIVLLKLAIPGQISLSILPQTPVSEGGETFAFGEMWRLWGLGDSGQTTLSGPENTKQPKTDKVESQPLLTLASLLMLGWSAVVLAGLLRLGWMVRRTRLLLRKTKPLEPDKIPIDLEQLRRIAGVKQPVRWVTASWVKAPITYGHFRPIIAVPPGMFANFTPDQIRWILLHELAHINGIAAAVSALEKFLQIVFFFHPVVWGTSSKIDQFREYVCDDIAMSLSRVPRGDCGQGFLSVAVQANGLPTLLPAALGMINYKTRIRRRLMRILEPNRILAEGLSLSATVFLVVLALAIIPFSGRTVIAQSPQFVFDTPANLGPTVNTSAKDYGPDMSADSLSLFFSSDRPGGAGSADIWVTTRETKDGDWGTPVNLGSTLNSPVVECDPDISADGSTLFFQSTRPDVSGLVLPKGAASSAPTALCAST